MKLTEHFTLAELTRSGAAAQHRLNNTPNNEELANLRRLARTLEAVRALLGHRPIVITSGFRSGAVNRAVGGVSTSAHRLGLAADFVCPTFGTPLEVCRAIAVSRIRFDQIIHEQSRWIHLGLSDMPARRQLLTFDGRSYQSGLLALAS